jgi:hypothetical protein
MWEQLLPHAEKWDVDSLTEKARAVDQCLVETTQKDAQWNPVSKAALIETGPYVTKDVLESFGVSADKDYVAGFIVAAFCIFSGRAIVADRLDRMYREKLEREKQRTKPAGQPAREESE